MQEVNKKEDFIRILVHFTSPAAIISLIAADVNSPGTTIK